MNREFWSGRMARRASALGASVVLVVGGVLGSGPSALASSAASPTGTVVSVAVGEAHSCALTSVGGVACWGRGLQGELGVPGTTASSTPVGVVGLTSGVAQISASHQTTCAVTVAGAVKCWGMGSSGQLGNGTKGWSATPVSVIGLSSGVASVSVGTFSVCALTTVGGVKCWGDGRFGTLGDGKFHTSRRPVAVTGLRSGVRAITVGEGQACAVRAFGVSCWGVNGRGELGLGDTTSRGAPVDVPGLGAGITSISAGGSSTCATRGDGDGDRVLCWGYNPSGRLGVGKDQIVVPTPTRVRGLAGISSVAGFTSVVAARGVTCATGPSELQCWGDDKFGVLGDGTNSRHYNPAPVVGLEGPVSSAAVGAFHSCAVTLGRALCWGQNRDGQLGDGTTTNSPVPVPVVGLGA